MNQDATLRVFLSKPLPAAATYAIILILLLFTIVNSLSDLFSQRTEVAAAATMLELPMPPLNEPFILRPWRDSA